MKKTEESVILRVYQFHHSRFCKKDREFREIGSLEGHEINWSQTGLRV